MHHRPLGIAAGTRAEESQRCMRGSGCSPASRAGEGGDECCARGQPGTRWGAPRSQLPFRPRPRPLAARGRPGRSSPGWVPAPFLAGSICIEETAQSGRCGGAGGREGGVRRGPLLPGGQAPRRADLVPRALQHAPARSASDPALCTVPSESPPATSTP